MEKLRLHFEKNRATYLVGFSFIVTAGAVIMQRVIVKNNNSSTDLLNHSIAQERANGNCLHDMLHDIVESNRVLTIQGR